MDARKIFLRSIFWVGGFTLIIWLVYFFKVAFAPSIDEFGVYPKTLIGLRGILFMPYIHGSLEHLISNSVPGIILGLVILNSYPRSGLLSILFIQIFSGLFVWMFAEPGYFHIGASGLIYGMASYLVACGWLRKDTKSGLIAFLVVVLYGGMIAGFSPGQEGISWQGHLFGAFCGVIAALLFNKLDPIQKIVLEDDTPKRKEHFFDED